MPERYADIRKKTMYIGHSNYAGDDRALGIPIGQCMKHIFIAGRTGKGKTSIQAKMMQSLMRLHEKYPDTAPGFAFVDPHGDAIKVIASIVPPYLKNKVHILHMRPTYFPRGFNFLDLEDPSQGPNVAADFVQLIRELFPGETGNRSDAYLRYALLSLIEASPQTILGIEALFTNDKFRDRIVAQIKDPMLKNFWSERGMFGKNKKQIHTIVGPILQKLGPFVTYPTIRRIVGQKKSTINIRKIMDNGEILLVDLSGIPEDVKKLLGAMMVTQFHFAALSRRDILKENDRRPFILMLDEVSVFATPIIAKILSEDRKFGLGLILATQYLANIPQTVLDGITGNIGTYYLLGLGLEDAQRLEKFFAPKVNYKMLAEIPALNAVVKTPAPNGTEVIFTVKYNYTPPGPDDVMNEIMEHSDRVDGRPADEVDKEIMAMLGMDSAEDTNPEMEQLDEDFFLNKKKATPFSIDDEDELEDE